MLTDVIKSYYEDVEVMNMNWFKRHLNWTMAIGWLLSLPVGIIISLFIFRSIAITSGQAVLAGFSGIITGTIAYLSILICLFLVGFWGCKEKKQNNWWSLLCFTGIGCIYLLFLSKK